MSWYFSSGKTWRNFWCFFFCEILRKILRKSKLSSVVPQKNIDFVLTVSVLGFRKSLSSFYFIKVEVKYLVNKSVSTFLLKYHCRFISVVVLPFLTSWFPFENITIPQKKFMQFLSTPDNDGKCKLKLILLTESSMIKIKKKNNFFFIKFHYLTLSTKITFGFDSL